MAQAFPLQWPQGWKRTHPNDRQRNRRYLTTPERAKRNLLDELRRLGAAGQPIISTNIELRRDGTPYANSANPADPGVAVYWSTNTAQERVIACDMWTEVFHNVHALGLAVAGMRAIERAGATQVVEQAFNAFGALPPAPGAVPVRPWWDVFGFAEQLVPHLTLGMVEGRYRELAPLAHPDRTGSESAMKELNAAREQAKAHFGT